MSSVLCRDWVARATAKLVARVDADSALGAEEDVQATVGALLGRVWPTVGGDPLQRASDGVVIEGSDEELARAGAHGVEHQLGVGTGREDHDNERAVDAKAFNQGQCAPGIAVKVDEDAIEGPAKPVSDLFEGRGIGFDVASMHVAAPGKRARGSNAALPVRADDGEEQR